MRAEVISFHKKGDAWDILRGIHKTSLNKHLIKFTFYRFIEKSRSKDEEKKRNSSLIYFLFFGKQNNKREKTLFCAVVK
jgi:hypothetical protein